jgi:hypothetical protein
MRRRLIAIAAVLALVTGCKASAGASTTTTTRPATTTSSTFTITTSAPDSAKDDAAKACTDVSQVTSASHGEAERLSEQAIGLADAADRKNPARWHHLSVVVNNLAVAIYSGGSDSAQLASAEGACA